MSILSNNVSDFYFSQLDKLTPDKQFHLASRLYLYCQDESSEKFLSTLKGYFTHNDQPEEAVKEVLKAARETLLHGSKNAAELRKPYFNKHPKLKLYVTVLFRITFLKTVYDIDCRQLLFKLFTEQELIDQRNSLLEDKNALAILSTHAINFLYLYNRVILEDDTSLPIRDFLRVGQTQYDHTNKLHLQLLVYLYTHCIIGETQFYYRSVPDKNKSVYREMLIELEKVIKEHFNDINLDNKFEFLVCAKIIGYETNLKKQIFEEAEKSRADTGDFLIDRLNNNPQINNITPDTSEHRNVLFIMANRQFSPLARD